MRFEAEPATPNQVAFVSKYFAAMLKLSSTYPLGGI